MWCYASQLCKEAELGQWPNALLNSRAAEKIFSLAHRRLALRDGSDGREAEVGRLSEQAPAGLMPAHCSQSQQQAATPPVHRRAVAVPAAYIFSHRGGRPGWCDGAVCAGSAHRAHPRQLIACPQPLTYLLTYLLTQVVRTAHPRQLIACPSATGGEPGRVTVPIRRRPGRAPVQLLQPREPSCASIDAREAPS